MINTVDGLGTRSLDHSQIILLNLPSFRCLIFTEQRVANNLHIDQSLISCDENDACPFPMVSDIDGDKMLSVMLDDEETLINFVDIETSSHQVSADCVTVS